MTILFDAYLMVDWSANSRPKRGKDSIWLGLTRPRQPVHLANPATRSCAVATLVDLLTGPLRDARVLVGWDFSFGYPTCTAQRLGGDGAGWRELWDTLTELVEDYDDNTNNRFDVAKELNRQLTDEAFPFWGHSGHDEDAYLRRGGCRRHGPNDLAKYRLVEQRLRTRPGAKPQPVWKLYYPGSVGSQALLGIPRVNALRHHPSLAANSTIWPFENGLRVPKTEATLEHYVVHAEIYPSLVPHFEITHKPKDAGQVAAIGCHFARLDAKGSLKRLFTPPDLTLAERARVEREEAWILGVD